MAYDVTQWLTEIKSLQRQLAELRQERDEAYNSAANWRRLYETEAQQRRTETNLLQQTVDDLRTELAQLQGSEVTNHHTAPQPQSALLEPDIEHLDEATVRAKLAEIIMERDRLLQALHFERAEHAQTRQSLTTALGDAVDRLTRERAEAQKGHEEETA